jgi:pSer/pThr/pTyr-binding forkhead associated (FHA) protein
MFDLANLSLDVVILLLRVALVALLYLFLIQVVQFIARDIQSGAASGSRSATGIGRLVLTHPGQTGLVVGRIFLLTAQTVIGRSAERCDIAFNDTSLSQQHARLALRGDTWMLEDLRSTNGTFLNDIEVRDVVAVAVGDSIRLGRIEVRLER